MSEGGEWGGGGGVTFTGKKQIGGGSSLKLKAQARWKSLLKTLKYLPEKLF